MTSHVSTPNLAPPGLDASFVARKPRSLASDAWRQFRRHRLAMFGASVLVLMLVFTLAGPLIYPADPRKIDFGISMMAPSRCGPCGRWPKPSRW